MARESNKTRKVLRYDDGGDVSDGSYDFQPDGATDGSGSSYTPPSDTAPTAADIGALTSSATSAPLPTQNVDVSYSPVDTSSSGSSSASNSTIGKILNTLGLGGGNTSNTGALTAAIGLLSAYGTYKGNQAKQNLPTMPAMGALAALPTLPGANNSTPASGYYGYTNPGGTGSTAPVAGAPSPGYAPRTQTTPAPAASYYTYGQNPEQQYFQQVNTNGGPIAPVAQHKQGGHIKKYGVGGAIAPVSQQNTNFGPTPVSGLPNGGAASMGAVFGSVPPQSSAGGALSNMVPSVTPSAAPQMATGSMGLSPGIASSLPMSPTANPSGSSIIGQAANQIAAPAQRTGIQQNFGGLSPAVTAQRPTLPQRPSIPVSQRLQRPGFGNRMMADGGPVRRYDGGGTTPTPPPGASGWAQGDVPKVGNPAQSGITGSGQSTLGQFAHNIRGTGRNPHLPMAHGGTPAGRHVRGPGDGTSDSIPARLASGEYVLSADVVSGLGNGDNGAGAKKLDSFVHNLRVHKAQNGAKGKLPSDAKPVESYMGAK